MDSRHNFQYLLRKSVLDNDDDSSETLEFVELEDNMKSVMSQQKCQKIQNVVI